MTTKGVVLVWVHDEDRAGQQRAMVLAATRFPSLRPRLRNADRYRADQYESADAVIVSERFPAIAEQYRTQAVPLVILPLREGPTLPSRSLGASAGADLPSVLRQVPRRRRSA